MSLPRITDGMHDDPNCQRCLGGGMSCERYPWRPWGPMVEAPPTPFGSRLGCWCGAAGKPCPRDAPCPECADDHGDPRWPEGCPPHDAGQHMLDDGRDCDYVVDRIPTDAEIERFQERIESADLTLESMVAAWEQVGISTMWRRRIR